MTLVVGVFTFAAGMQAVTWLISTSSATLYEKFGWMDVEQKILDQLGPNVQVGYVQELLGEPILRDGGEKYQEFVFKRKFGYIQIVADRNDKTVLYSAVVCRTDFRPTIQSFLGQRLIPIS